MKGIKTKLPLKARGILLLMLFCLAFIPGSAYSVAAESPKAETQGFRKAADLTSDEESIAAEEVAGEDPEIQSFGVTLPIQMELCQGYSLTDGKAAYGTEIKFQVKKNYIGSNIKANDTDLTGEDNIYTITVTEDVTVTGEFEKVKRLVSFVDENNNQIERSAYILDGTEGTLEEGWYFAEEDVTFNHQLTLTGDVGLILGRNVKMVVSEEENSCIYSLNNSLSVYTADSNEMGRLNLETGNNNACSPICLAEGSYTQNGGYVRVSGSNSMVIGRDLTMNQGTLRVNINDENKAGVTAGGSVNFNQGEVRFVPHGENTVSVEASEDIVFAGAGVEFGRLSASASCRIADGLIYTDGSNLYESSTESSVLEDLRGVFFDRAHIVRIEEAANGSVSADKTFFADHENARKVNLSLSSQNGSIVKSVSIDGVPLEPVNGVYSFNMPLNDVTISAEFTAFVGCSLSLNGTTDVNFYLSIKEEHLPKAKILFEYGEREPFEAGLLYDRARQMYKATCPVSAAYMTCDIRACYYYDGELAEEHIYSVKQYAEDILKNSSVYPAEASLVKAMLNYGANAQEFFNVNTDRPANAGLSEEEKTLGEVMIEKTYSSDLPESIGFEGATLSLKSATTLSLYFIAEETLEFSCEGWMVEKQRNGDYQIARIRNIGASEVQDDFTLTVKAGDRMYSITYSPLNYIRNAVNSSDAELCNVAKALYFYSAAAMDYFSHWTVTFDLNGSEEDIEPITVNRGDYIVLPTPQERHGYIFEGWYTAAEGGNTTGENFLPSANIRLYAHWKPFPKILCDVTGGTVEVFVNDKKIENNDIVRPGSVVKVVVTYDDDLSTESSFGIAMFETGLPFGTSLSYYSDEACEVTTTSKQAGTYYFRMPDNDVTIGIPWSAACVVKGTLVTLADGTVKPVEQVKPGDELLVWNMETGRYDRSPVVFNHADPEREYRVMRVCFSDNTEVGIVYEHGFFDLTLGQYVYINENTKNDYIGHQFIRQGDLYGNSWDTVTLTEVRTETKEIEVYNPGTVRHLNFYANGMLSVSADTDALTNIFDIDPEIMAYDQKKMQEDIERYGLFTLEEFKDLLPEDLFYAFNAAWMKVSIGKGLITWEHIQYLAEHLAELF